MRLAVSGLGSLGLSFLLTGCAVDLRCEPASQRIAMHEGEAWQLDRFVTGGTAEKNVRALGDAVDPENYCTKRAEKKSRGGLKAADALEGTATAKLDFDEKRAAISKLFSKLEFVDLATAKKSGFDVDKWLKAQFPGSCPAPKVRAPTGVPNSSAEVIRDYFLGNEIYLSDRKLKAVGRTGVATGIDMHIVDENLNCSPTDSDERPEWRCGYENVVEKPFNPTGTLATCFASAPNSGTHTAANLVGLFDERYCVSVSILESKSADAFDKSEPTRITKDALIVGVWCGVEGSDESIGPGVVIGGPRPNFRDPAQDM